jgi:hypothetical protein
MASRLAAGHGGHGGPTVDPSSFWVAAAGDLREAAEGRGGDVGEDRETALAKATGRRWAAATPPPAKGTVSSTPAAATQANRFAYRVLQRYVSTPK